MPRPPRTPEAEAIGSRGIAAGSAGTTGVWPPASLHPEKSTLPSRSRCGWHVRGRGMHNAWGPPPEPTPVKRAGRGERGGDSSTANFRDGSSHFLLASLFPVSFPVPYFGKFGGGEVKEGTKGVFRANRKANGKMRRVLIGDEGDGEGVI
jgi:hypothetical protein